jgi:hypothetical protein
MIKAGIIGGAGYTAGELIRLLLNHPDVEIAFINSSSNAGNKITDVHEGLYGETDLVFTDELPLDTIDVLFFCTAHSLYAFSSFFFNCSGLKPPVLAHAAYTSYPFSFARYITVKEVSNPPLKATTTFFFSSMVLIFIS